MSRAAALCVAPRMGLPAAQEAGCALQKMMALTSAVLGVHAHACLRQKLAWQNDTAPGGPPEIVSSWMCLMRRAAHCAAAASGAPSKPYSAAAARRIGALTVRAT